jgi:hypothetical protein
MGPSRAPRRTDQQHVTPAVGNLFEAKPGPATFVGSAYMPVLQHLREGPHTRRLRRRAPRRPAHVFGPVTNTHQ